MIWFTVVLALLLVIITWILCTPIIIFIDTLENEYYVKVKGICKINLNTTKEPITIDIIVPIRKFSFSPLEEERKKYKYRIQKKNKTKRKSLGTMITFIADLLKSFDLIKMRLNVDTHDYIHNAQLVPIFYFLSGKNKTFSVNFNGDTNLQLILRNRLIRVLKPAIIMATR